MDGNLDPTPVSTKQSALVVSQTPLAYRNPLIEAALNKLQFSEGCELSVSMFRYG